MNPNDQRRWRKQVLEFALAAFAAHEPLRSALVFKGARILNLRLGDTAARESFDLDSNLDVHCETAHPFRTSQPYVRRLALGEDYRQPHRPRHAPMASPRVVSPS